MNNPFSLTPSSPARIPSHGSGAFSRRWLWALLAFLAGALLFACASDWGYIWEHADDLFNGDSELEDYGFGASSSDDLSNFADDGNDDDRD